MKKISNKEEQTDIHSLRTKDGRDIQFSQSLLFVIQIHIIKMKLSDYTISKPPRELSLLFNELIITRTHKRFIVEKPELKRIAVDIGQSLKKRPSSVFSYNVDHNE